MGGFKGEYLVNLFRGEDVVLELHSNINYAKGWLITRLFFSARRGTLFVYNRFLIARTSRVFKENFVGRKETVKPRSK